MSKLPRLKKSTVFEGRKGPVLLIIMDGVGNGKQDDSDGVYLADTPTLDSLKKSKLYTEMLTHGPAVGLPTYNDMGNSEVGHNTLGAGRILPKGALLVQKSIDNGDIYQGDTWKKLLQNCKTNQSTLHFIGLLSDGNVHAHCGHLFSLLKKAQQTDQKRVRVHILLDGRDVAGRSALHYLEQLNDVLDEINANPDFDYKIASGGGRMHITMDRYDADWPMVKRGWDTHILGKGPEFETAKEAIENAYDSDPNLIDQYLPEFVISENGTPVGTIQDNDSVIMTNFRGDRAMELSLAFEKENFDKFDRERHPKVEFAGMVQYDGDLKIPNQFLIPFPKVERPISEYFCGSDITSFAISETQKYGHVTYFWNGNNSNYIDKDLETYIEVPSYQQPFDAHPEMKAHEITEKTIELLRSGKYKFGRLNFPNGDMVGHTTNRDAIIESVRVTDECVTKLIDVVKELDGITVICADHGNADELYTIKKGEKILSPAHSLNLVPFSIVDSGYKDDYEIADLEQRSLANVASTLCNLLGFEKPTEYEPSLIKFIN